MLNAHYHITLDNVDINSTKNAAKLIKGKVTEIDLSLDSGDLMKERMLTKYQKGSLVTNLFDDVLLLRNNNFIVTRYKLEIMFNDFNEIEKYILSDLNYIEINIKVPKITEQKNYDMFKMSNNPNEKEYYFYNGRCRDKNILSNFIETYKKILSDTESNNVHLEYIAYDSKPNHDRIWL